MNHCTMMLARKACGQQASFMVYSATLDDYPACRVHLTYVIDMAISEAPHKNHTVDTVTVQRIQRKKHE